MAERDAAAARGTHARAGVTRRAGRVVPGEVVEPVEESHPNGAGKAPAEGTGAGAAGDAEAALAPETGATTEAPAEAEAPTAAEAPTEAEAENADEAPEAKAAGEATPEAAESPEGSGDGTPPAGSGAPTGDVVLARRDVTAAFPTEESLAQQGEATTQLRRAIDELRQMLDVDAVPPMPAPTPRRRRRGAALLAVAVAAVVVVASVVALRGGDDDATTARPAPSPPTPSAVAPSVGLPAPYPPPPGTAPLSGPGVDEPGTLLVVRLDGQALQITEQAILREPATSQIPLILSDVSRLGGDIAGLRPQVTEVRAALDRRPAPVRAAGEGRWFVPVTGAPTRVAVSYRVTGAVLPTQPSGAGRALVLVQPLLGRGLVPAQLPLVVRTTGMTGLGAACPDAPAALSLCGEGDGHGNWTATVPQSLNPSVVVQVDLPAR